MKRGARFAALAVGFILAVPAHAQTFPFTIDSGRFVLDGRTVFLNVIGYQPLKPGQDVASAIDDARVLDDLRRLRAWRRGSDPIALRVYPQPTTQYPNRM